MISAIFSTNSLNINFILYIHIRMGSNRYHELYNEILTRCTGLGRLSQTCTILTWSQPYVVFNIFVNNLLLVVHSGVRVPSPTTSAQQWLNLVKWVIMWVCARARVCWNRRTDCNWVSVCGWNEYRVFNRRPALHMRSSPTMEEDKC